MSNFTGKMSAGLAGTAQAMKNGKDNFKLNGQIAEQEKMIKNLTNELGNLVLIQLDAGEKFNPAVMERYEAIKEARQVIETTSSAKKVKKMICPKCGSKTATGMNYCGVCGAKITD
ncbi:MAG: hypothetical protein IJ763_08460 [Lachnospiraceae bacterium]|nr:hypothetical protein [Lachnospiraceae bacterium]